jgi:hypothetical protein
MTKKKRFPCPECGKSASGNFCQHCGADLGVASCPECGAPATGARRFCNECGASMRALGGGGGSPRRRSRVVTKGGDVSWWVAGSAMAVLATALAWNVLGNQSAPPVGAAVPQPVVPVSPGIAQATPRQTADQLFNRVMTASDNGDAATVEQFLPLALSAYEAARPLDMDGLFHVALLQRTGDDLEASLATAQEMLQIEPKHILGLNVAAEAAAAMGRDDEAAAYYREVLDNLDAEMARPLFEYQTHSRYFEVTRQEALAFLSERG